jgi:hypothetical protein
MHRFLILLLFVGLPLMVHAAGPILCDVQTGATADVKINNAIGLLPATGGTIDCRGLTGAQTIAGNVNMNVANTKFIFADGSTFTASASNVALIGTASGIEIECGGAGGTVFDWHTVTSIGANPQVNFNSSNVRIHHCTFIGDRLPPASGAASCIRFQNTTTQQSNIYVEDNFIQNCGGVGISVINYSNVHVQRNLITQTSNIGIQWNTTSSPSTAVPYREIEITDNVLYDDNTGNTTGVGAILVGNTGGQTVQGVVVRNNVIKNDIVGSDGNNGDFKGNANICNGSNSNMSTGCGQPIEVNNATFVNITDNVAENTQGECIAFTASDVLVRGNRLNLCGGTVNTNPTTILNAGAGGILAFMTNSPATTQNVLIDANHITNAGYGVGAQLGSGVNMDIDLLLNVTVSNNVISASNPSTGQSVIRGIDLDNRSSANACGALNTTGASVTGNVATLTFGSSPIAATYVVGETAVISGFSGADTFFNGTFVLTGVTSTTVTYALTHANATATTNGTMNRQCNFTLTDINIVNNTVYNASTQAYSLLPLTNPTTMTGAPNLSGNLGNLSSASAIANCSSSASPAVCSGAASGSVTIPAGAATVVVNTTAVTAVSQIQVEFDEALGTKLGVTCNNSTGSENATYLVTARTPGTSFTIKTSSFPLASPACLSYVITN